LPEKSREAPKTALSLSPRPVDKIVSARAFVAERIPVSESSSRYVDSDYLQTSFIRISLLNGNAGRSKRMPPRFSSHCHRHACKNSREIGNRGGTSTRQPLVTNRARIPLARIKSL
jgi:hypothetical protein